MRDWQQDHPVGVGPGDLSAGCCVDGAPCGADSVLPIFVVENDEAVSWVDLESDELGAELLPAAICARCRSIMLACCSAVR